MGVVVVNEAKRWTPDELEEHLYKGFRQMAAPRPLRVHRRPAADGDRKSEKTDLRERFVKTTVERGAFTWVSCSRIAYGPAGDGVAGPASGADGRCGVLWELRDGSAPSFRERQARCGDISSSVLIDRLRELARRGDRRRERSGGYRLSREGLALIDALAPMDAWAKRWARRTAG